MKNKTYKGMKKVNLFYQKRANGGMDLAVYAVNGEVLIPLQNEWVTKAFMHSMNLHIVSTHYN